MYISKFLYPTRLKQLFSSKELLQEEEKGRPEYAINKRAVIAMREIAGGYSAIGQFCGIMNMPPPMTKTTFYNHLSSVHEPCVSVPHDACVSVSHGSICVCTTRKYVCLYHTMHVCLYHTEVCVCTTRSMCDAVKELRSSCDPEEVHHIGMATSRSCFTKWYYCCE